MKPDLSTKFFSFTYPRDILGDFIKISPSEETFIFVDFLLLKTKLLGNPAIPSVTQKLDPTKIIQVIDCIDKPLTRNAVGV